MNGISPPPPPAPPLRRPPPPLSFALGGPNNATVASFFPSFLLQNSQKEEEERESTRHSRRLRNSLLPPFHLLLCRCMVITPIFFTPASASLKSPTWVAAKLFPSLLSPFFLPLRTRQFSYLARTKIARRVVVAKTNPFPFLFFFSSSIFFLLLL